MLFDNFFFFLVSIPPSPPAPTHKRHGVPPPTPRGCPPCQPLHSEAGREPARGAVAESTPPPDAPGREYQRDSQRHAGEHQSESISEPHKQASGSSRIAVFRCALFPRQCRCSPRAMLYHMLYDTKRQQHSFLPHGVH